MWGEPASAGVQEEGTGRWSSVTRCYLGPEILAGMLAGGAGGKVAEAYDAVKHDVWAAGIVLCIMLLGQNPFGFDEVLEYAGFQGALKHAYSVQSHTSWREAAGRQLAEASLTPSVCDLIDHMLDKDPVARWGPSQVLGHPWMSRALPGKYGAVLRALDAEQGAMVERLRKGHYAVAQREADIRNMVELAQAPPDPPGSGPGGEAPVMRIRLAVSADDYVKDESVGRTLATATSIRRSLSTRLSNSATQLDDAMSSGGHNDTSVGGRLHAAMQRIGGGSKHGSVGSPSARPSLDAAGGNAAASAARRSMGAAGVGAAAAGRRSSKDVQGSPAASDRPLFTPFANSARAIDGNDGIAGGPAAAAAAGGVAAAVEMSSPGSLDHPQSIGRLSNARTGSGVGLLPSPSASTPGAGGLYAARSSSDHQQQQQQGQASGALMATAQSQGRAMSGGPESLPPTASSLGAAVDGPSSAAAATVTFGTPPGSGTLTKQPSAAKKLFKKMGSFLTGDKDKDAAAAAAAAAAASYPAAAYDPNEGSGHHARGSTVNNPLAASASPNPGAAAAGAAAIPVPQSPGGVVRVGVRMPSAINPVRLDDIAVSAFAAAPGNLYGGKRAPGQLNTSLMVGVLETIPQSVYGQGGSMHGGGSGTNSMAGRGHSGIAGGSSRAGRTVEGAGNSQFEKRSGGSQGGGTTTGSLSEGGQGSDSEGLTPQHARRSVQQETVEE